MLHYLDLIVDILNSTSQSDVLEWKFLRWNVNIIIIGEKDKPLSLYRADNDIFVH